MSVTIKLNCRNDWLCGSCNYIGMCRCKLFDVGLLYTNSSNSFIRCMECTDAETLYGATEKLSQITTVIKLTEDQVS